MNRLHLLRLNNCILAVLLIVAFIKPCSASKIENAPGICGSGGGRIWIGMNSSWNPSMLGLKIYPDWSVSLPSFGLAMGNNAYSTAFLGDYFVEGKRLSDNDVNKILSEISSDQLNLNWHGGVSGLGFTYNGFGMTLFDMHTICSAAFPKDVFELVMGGWEKDKLYDFSDVSTEYYRYWTTSFSMARSLPTTPGFLDELSVGARLKLLFGIEYYGLGNTSGYLQVTSDSVKTDGLMEFVKSESGAGLGIDIGASGWLSPLSSYVGVTFGNAIGSINWSDVEIDENRFERHNGVSLDSLSNRDYWNNFFNESDTTYEAGSKTVSLPKYLLLTLHRPEMYLDGRGDISVSIHQGLNDVPGNSFIPKLSVGSTFQQLPWLNLRLGMGFGGIEGFELGGGFGIDYALYHMNFGASWQRGVFNGSKGFSIALSNSLYFPSGYQPVERPKKPKKEKVKKEKSKKEEPKKEEQIIEEEEKLPEDTGMPTAPSAPSGMKALTLADIGLKDMDPGQVLCAKALYPFEDNPVFYSVIKSEKYDKFFKDVAEITGTALMAEKIIEAIEAGNKDVLAMYKLPELTAESPLYTFCTETLPNASRNATTLITTGNQLLGSSRRDFTGLNARKLPSVIKGVNGSVNNLKTARDKIDELVEKISTYIKTNGEEEVGE
ncbi:DUF5723 family protein [bacterium]|nr:DUF5723 family protein [bacterium]